MPRSCDDSCWNLADYGWAHLTQQLDEFLSTAIARVEAVYDKFPANWLELNCWPDSGRLIVYPSTEGPFGERDEKVFLQLFSDYLRSEFDRIGSLDRDQQDQEWDALGERFWGAIEACLTTGKARAALSAARRSSPLRIAAFDYEPGEGLFHLGALDQATTAEINRQLAAYKNEWGIPT